VGLVGRLSSRVGGFVHPQVRSDLRWELRALGVRVRTAVRPPAVGPGPFRLNIGAGPHRVTGWTTVDLEPGADVVADVRWRIPLPDGSCEAIFCEHTVEHLRFKGEAPRFLAECRRLLAPGAPMRVSVPDASLYLRRYVEGDLGPLNELHPWGDSPMTTVNWTFHGYGHRFGYDEATLTALLRDAGFVDVRRKSFGVTDYDGLALDRPEREVESLYLEARAPA
jgi:predicted SAM-dependent methyltransferase